MTKNIPEQNKSSLETENADQLEIVIGPFVKYTNKKQRCFKKHTDHPLQKQDGKLNSVKPKNT